MNTNYNINISVNSTKSYSNKTIPIIIPSLIESGVNSKNIYVFEGQNYKREIIKFSTHTLVKTNHASLDFTGLIDIVENEMESDYWFHIHDTCRVGKNFWKLLNNIPNNYPDKIALWTHYSSMNIGLYKYGYLMKHKNKLIKIKNQDYSSESIQKLKHWTINNEDYILYRTEDSPTLLYNPKLIGNGYYIKEEKSWYDGTMRRIEYYPHLDLYKSKSNFFRKPVYELTL